MEEDLMAYLLADPNIQAAADDRVHWTQAPQGVAEPYATLLKVTGLRDTTQDGPSGFQEARIQIDSYGLTFSAAKNLARAFETALSGMSQVVDNTEFQGCFLDTERDGFEDEASPDKLYRTSLDFIIFHKEI